MEQIAYPVKEQEIHFYVIIRTIPPTKSILKVNFSYTNFLTFGVN